MYKAAPVEDSEDERRAQEECEPSPLGTWVALLGAEVWVAAISWVAVIAHFYCFYWHSLNPRNLGADYMSIAIYLVVMVIIPLLLEIPLLMKAMKNKFCSLVFIVLLMIFVLWGDKAASERHRSIAFVMAMLCVDLRMVAILVQPAPTKPQLATERAVTPWAVSMGLFLVVVLRSTVALHSLRESITGTLLFIFMSAVAVVLKVVLSPTSDEEEAKMDTASCCGSCGASLTAGVLLPTLLMFSLWVMDAPWAVAHFVGLYGPVYRMLFLLAFAAGVGQTLVFPMSSFTNNSFGAAVVCTVQIILGGLLLAFSSSQLGFFGGCLLTVGVPGAWMLAFQLASGSVQGRAAGRTLSLCGFVFFLELLAYMGTLANSTPVMGAYFWGKFWLFGTVLIVCFVIPFSAVGSKKTKFKGESSAEACKTSCVWLVFLLVIALALTFSTTSIMPPQQTGRGLVVASYNVQQGYHLDGTPNFDCVTDALKTQMPHVVGLQESDSVHVVSSNTNVLGYIADKLGWHRTVGPAGHRSSAGVSLVSQYEMRDEQVQQMPATVGGALNRFLVRSTIAVNSTDVVVFSVHTEWFGDPAVQIGFIADEVNKVKGPVILVGDFNLDVSGQNDATIAANISTNGFQKLLDLSSTGLKSVTPIHVGKCTMVTNDNLKYCPGKYTTVWMGADGVDTTPGYQLDYIWYRGLNLIADSFTVSAKSQSCSDHLLIQATFVLP